MPPYTMKSRRCLNLSIACLILGISACKPKENGAISPDLVNNPASADGSSSDASVPRFEFVSDTHDFGTIKQGDKVSFQFDFTNAGKGDLLIASASGSCGCTVPEYPKNPIHAGDKSSIKVTFDSAGKNGKVSKTVTIISNTIPNTKVITITADILVP